MGERQLLAAAWSAPLTGSNLDQVPDMSLTPAEEALPEVVRLYLSAHDRGDADMCLASFSAHGRVHDDGDDYVGAQAIRNWLTEASRRFAYTRTLVSTTSVGPNSWVLVNRLEGDFPGGVVDLHYRFLLVDNLIAELVIAP